MAYQIVVSDTTAITHLAKIGALNILHQLYTTIYIPDAVYVELTSHGLKNPGSYEAQTYPWIKRVSVKDKPLVDTLLKTLDAGESEAIALAKQMNADLLIIDEKLGRGHAKKMEITIVGMVGVLLSAKKKGVTLKVQPYLDRLITTGFKLSPKIYNMALDAAGENEAFKKA